MSFNVTREFLRIKPISLRRTSVRENLQLVDHIKQEQMWDSAIKRYYDDNKTEILGV